MAISDSSCKKQLFVYAGQYHVTREDMILRTTVGSCVSVCLFDPVQGVVGMNHIMNSSEKYAQPRGAFPGMARYGLFAMEMTLKSMVRNGARLEDIQAKAFGGAAISVRNNAMIQGDFCVGQRNIDFVKEFLHNKKIPLVAQNLGGGRGMSLCFDTGDFSVYVKEIPAILANEFSRRKGHCHECDSPG